MGDSQVMARLLGRHLQDLKPGRLEWIGLRPTHKADLLEVTKVEAISDLGLTGDRRCQGKPGSKRQVTLINQEHIALIAELMGLSHISPALLRRNLVVSGINLLALRHQRFSIGAAEFETTLPCHPCIRMEQALGKGAIAAMFGHGGICAKVIKGGMIHIGDEVIHLST